MFIKNNKKWYDFFMVIIGTFIVSSSVIIFFEPNNLILGGVSGVSIIIKELFVNIFNIQISLSIISFFINIPLLIIAYFVIGKKFIKKTLISAILFSLFLELEKFLPVYNNEMILASIYGGVMLGFGSGLILKGKATSGGSDLLAAIIYKLKNNISISKILFIIDFIIILLGVLIFGIENSMYSIISIFICTKITEFMINKINFAKAVFIISDESENIAFNIINNLNRGVTSFKGKGMYKGDEKDILLCVFTPKEISDVKNIIKNIDKNAFILITNINEVIGQGFLYYNI